MTGTSVCRGCGAWVLWVKTPKGKWMPCETEPVGVVEAGGTDRIVTPGGRVLVGLIVDADDPRATAQGHVPHWVKCKQASRFRKDRDA